MPIASMGCFAMSFESTVTEYDLDPAARQFAEELRRQQRGGEANMSVDGLEDTLGERFLRLFRRDPS